MEFHERGELLVTEGPNRNRITNPGDGRIGWFRTAKKLIGAFSNVCVCVCLLVFFVENSIGFSRESTRSVLRFESVVCGVGRVGRLCGFLFR